MVRTRALIQSFIPLLGVSPMRHSFLRVVGVGAVVVVAFLAFAYAQRSGQDRSAAAATLDSPPFTASATDPPGNTATTNPLHPNVPIWWDVRRWRDKHGGHGELTGVVTATQPVTARLRGPGRLPAGHQPVADLRADRI